jgi:uncharacterized protein
MTTTSMPGTAARASIEGVPYHRLTHLTPATSRWWRPIATLAVAGGLFFGAQIFLGVGLGVVSVFLPAGWQPSALMDDPTRPADVVLTEGLIALLVPAVVLGARWGGGTRGVIHSVAGRLRWNVLGRAAAVVVPLYVVVMAVGTAFSGVAFDPPTVNAPSVTAFALILLLVPLQCAGEEYAFRALPQQALGTWLRSPAWGILLPILPFVVAHGYSWQGQVQVGFVALCAGVLVWKCGGLELAIALHTANNLGVFLVAVLTGAGMREDSGSTADLASSLALTAVATAALMLVASRVQGTRWLEPLRFHPAPSASRDRVAAR